MTKEIKQARDAVMDAAVKWEEAPPEGHAACLKAWNELEKAIDNLILVAAES